MAKNDTVFLRNKRPNAIVFHYAGTRVPLAHRGNRADSVALPAEALEDAQVSRWIQVGQLEKISQEDYISLQKRRIDVLPNEFLKQSNIRNQGAAQTGVPLEKTGADTGNVDQKDVIADVRDRVSPKWAGDLMTTEEELEVYDYTKNEESANYPSKYRDEAARNQMGY